MTIKVGIIGCGKIAQVRHIPEYMANPNAELRGLSFLCFQLKALSLSLTGMQGSRTGK